MNLKEVARRLDVHYQSVYRWVRSGELEAVRFGARYDVSEASLTQFLARRRPVDAGGPVPEQTHEPRRAGDLSRADALEELEAFALDPVVSVAAVVALAASRGSSVLGDLCVVAHMDPGGAADIVSAEHPDVDRATFARAALEIGAGDAASPAGMAAFDYEQRQVLRVAHIPQDRVQRALPRELRQYWPKFAVHSLLAVPIPQGRAVSGVMRYSRDQPNAPYTADDEVFAVQYATRVGALFATADEIALAWRARAGLVDTLEARGAFEWPDDATFGEELARIVDTCVGTDQLPIVLLDDQARVLTANRAFERATGHRRETLVGRPIGELTGAADVELDRGNFDRLATGALDFSDVLARRVLGDGTERIYATHRGAVRSVAGTFRCSVGVWRALHIPDADKDTLLR